MDGTTVSGLDERGAKGYPDVARRAFLHALASPTAWNNFTAPKVYALVDYDPDGICILSTYKYGSAALKHENIGLAVDKIQWIGLNSYQAISAQGSNNYQEMIVLSQRDRGKAKWMLISDVCGEDGLEPRWRRELQVMLILNLKAEVQIWDSANEGLSDWLLARLLRPDNECLQ
ncbi:MAG: hypothetical protein M1820_001576 [Bogoriella megaspora]|nr:MAG: hypothetical protein M1820_001576 [Bogoriella megaspora]